MGNPRRIATNNVPDGATRKRRGLKRRQLERTLSNRNSMVPTSLSTYLETNRNTKITNKWGPAPALITVQPKVLLGAKLVNYQLPYLTSSIELRTLHLAHK